MASQASVSTVGGGVVILRSSTSLSVKLLRPRILEELCVRSVCLPALICLSHFASITPIRSLILCQVHHFWMISCLTHQREAVISASSETVEGLALMRVTRVGIFSLSQILHFTLFETLSHPVRFEFPHLTTPTGSDG